MAKKKKKFDDSALKNIGALMNISLFLIILTFFVLLNSIAKIDDRRLILAIGSLIGAFGSFKGGLSPLNTGDVPLPPTPPMIKETADFKNMMSKWNLKVLGDISKVKTDMEKASITINESVLFSENRPELRPSSYPMLNDLCSLINEGDYSIEIVGHTDNRPAEEKGYQSNWELSALMAIRVLRYFVEEGKVPAERLTANGCGIQRPIVSNDTRQSRALNRRVEIVFDDKAPAYIKRVYRKRPTGIFTYKKFDFRVFSE